MITERLARRSRNKIPQTGDTEATEIQAEDTEGIDFSVPS